jgi:hypothetical protein
VPYSFMLLGPLQLIGTIGSFVTLLQARYEAYGQLQDNKQGSLLALRDTISHLIDELRVSQRFVELLPEHTSSFADFLNSDKLSPYWKDFESTLANVQSRCHPLEALASELFIASLSSGKKNVTKTLIASNIFSDTLTKSIKRIDAVTASVVEDTKSVEYAYRNLYRVYLLYVILSANFKPRRSSLSTPTDFLGNTIDVVTSAFHHRPFCLSTTSVSADDLFKLNRNREKVEQITNIMKEEGSMWVEDSWQSNSFEDSWQSGSVNKLGQIQIRLMEVLWAICIPHMESEVLQFARCIDRDWIGDTELKTFGDALKIAIRRAQNQQFSIAFCGMVKAGCVV